MKYAYQVNDKNEIIGGPIYCNTIDAENHFRDAGNMVADEKVIHPYHDEIGNTIYRINNGVIERINNCEQYQAEYIRRLSADSLAYSEKIMPTYRVRNAERGNIYSEQENANIIATDKRIAAACREEYYRVKALILQATTEDGVKTAYEQQQFNAIA